MRLSSGFAGPLIITYWLYNLYQFPEPIWYLFKQKLASKLNDSMRYKNIYLVRHSRIRNHGATRHARFKMSFGMELLCLLTVFYYTRRRLGDRSTGVNLAVRLCFDGEWDFPDSWLGTKVIYAYTACHGARHLIVILNPVWSDQCGHVRNCGFVSLGQAWVLLPYQPVSTIRLALMTCNNDNLI